MTAVRNCVGQDARAGNDQIALLDHGLGAVGVDAGQRDQRQNLMFGLQNVDRRLPGRQPRLDWPPGETARGACVRRARAFRTLRTTSNRGPRLGPCHIPSSFG